MWHFIFNIFIKDLYFSIRKTTLCNCGDDNILYTLRNEKILLKKRLWYRCFLVNFAKFLKTPFSQNTSGRLFLPLAPSPCLFVLHFSAVDFRSFLWIWLHLLKKNKKQNGKLHFLCSVCYKSSQCIRLSPLIKTQL